jgi:hypothetical protein
VNAACNSARWQQRLANCNGFVMRWHAIINLPHGNWHRLSGDCIARYRNWSKPRQQAHWPIPLADNTTGVTRPAAAERFRRIRHVIAANVNHQGFVFHVTEFFRRGATTASVALPSLLTTSTGKSPKCPIPPGLRVYRFYRVEVTTSRLGSRGFSVFHRRLT